MSQDDNHGEHADIPNGRREFFGKLLAAGAAGGTIVATSSTAKAGCAEPVEVKTEVLVTENSPIDPEAYKELIIARLLDENVIIPDDNNVWRSKVTVLVNSGCVR